MYKCTYVLNSINENAKGKLKTVFDNHLEGTVRKNSYIHTCFNDLFVACVCNGFASTCDNQTGVCPCNVPGVTGKTCDRCSVTFGMGELSSLDYICAGQSCTCHMPVM